MRPVRWIPVVSLCLLGSCFCKGCSAAEADQVKAVIDLMLAILPGIKAAL